MKKIIHRISVLAVLMVAFTTAVMSQKPNKAVVNELLVKRATEAFHANCDAAWQPMASAVIIKDVCDSGEPNARVVFYSKLNCPRATCEFTRPILLGSVEFNCGNVVKVYCGQ